MPRRLRAGLSAGFSSLGQGFERIGQDIHDEREATRRAVLQDDLQRQRTADEKEASGEWSPEQAESYRQGRAAGPSVEQEVTKIIGDIKPTTPPGALASQAKAKRLPVLFGEQVQKGTEPPGENLGMRGTPESGNLPSKQYGPQSPAWNSIMDAYDETIRAQKPEKIGSDSIGAGENRQPVDIFGYRDPRTGTTTRETVPAGMTAGAKGEYEGTAGRVSRFANELNPERMAAEQKQKVSEEEALAPIKAKTAGAESYARATAQLRAEIAQTGMTNAQRTTTMQLADNYTKDSQHFAEAEVAFNGMIPLAKRAATGDATAGIMLIVRAFQVTEPQGIVRESERDMMTAATDLKGRAENLFNVLTKGKGSLNAAQVNAIVANARDSYVAEKRLQDERDATYRQRAYDWKIPEHFILRKPSVAAAEAVLQSITSAGGASKLGAVTDAQGNVIGGGR